MSSREKNLLGKQSILQIARKSPKLWHWPCKCCTPAPNLSSYPNPGEFFLSCVGFWSIHGYYRPITFCCRSANPEYLTSAWESTQHSDSNQTRTPAPSVLHNSAGREAQGSLASKRHPDTTDRKSALLLANFTLNASLCKPWDLNQHVQGCNL